MFREINLRQSREFLTNAVGDVGDIWKVWGGKCQKEVHKEEHRVHKNCTRSTQKITRSKKDVHQGCTRAAQEVQSQQSASRFPPTL